MTCVICTPGKTAPGTTRMAVEPCQPVAFLLVGVGGNADRHDALLVSVE